MKSFLFVLFFFSISSSSFAQQQDSSIIWISSGSTGSINTINLNDCSFRSVCSTGKNFLDIAFTPNGKLWGRTIDTLFQIDTINGNTIIIGPAPIGNALVGLDDSTLLIDSLQYLYAIKTTDATTRMVGYVGYLSDGDLTWFGTNLYMVGQGFLVKMVLNDSYTNILSIDTLRNVVDPYVYYTPSLTTAYITGLGYTMVALPGGDDVYKLDTVDAAYGLLCTPSAPYSSYGAASMIFPPIPQPVSTSETKIQNGTIEIYPNPATDKLYVALQNFNGNTSDVGMELISYTGKLLQQRGLRSTKDEIDISGYPPGVYLVRFTYRNMNLDLKKIIKR